MTAAALVQKTGLFAEINGTTNMSVMNYAD
jgi:hypothetical protein